MPFSPPSRGVNEDGVRLLHEAFARATVKWAEGKLQAESARDRVSGRVKERRVMGGKDKLTGGP